MSNLYDFAKHELELINGFEDSYSSAVSNAVLNMIKLFAEQGHSGFTAPYAIRQFERLAMWKPLKPLTGEDDEWSEIGDGCYQNKRYSAVFKDKDGRAYTIEGKIFTRDGGETWFTNKDSFVDITFPYEVPDHPERVYLEAEDDECEQEEKG